MGALLAEEYGLKAGSRVEVGDERIRIVGIADERGMGLDINPDFGVIVTYEWYVQRYGEQDFSRVIIKVEDIDDIAEVKTAIDEQLNRRTEKVDIMDSRELLELFFDTITAINVFLVGIGGVSLFVSGISILTVMIISVTERTREIGILRSIGTRRGEIMLLFLFEALVLGVVGSLIGGAVSTVAGYAIYLSLNELLFGGIVAGAQAPEFGLATMAFILFGMIFGTATSVLAGAYPAWKASLLNPIEALHYE
jgi:putative ABC transport system permease protein